MATEMEKKKRLLSIFNIAMYGIIKGLWELFGEASFATVDVIGDQLLSMLEKEMGLEIQGEDPNDILLEIARLLVDEVGMMSACEPKLEDNRIQMACTECALREATAYLEEKGIQPFACIPMGVVAAAMRKRMNQKHRVLGRKWDEATQTCTIMFELM